MKEGKIVSVPDIPQFDIPANSTLFIATRDVSYASHGIHEFPAKYIPQIPRWAILKYCGTKRTNWVLDPFCGSGTTLVEARLQGVNSYGIDIDPMARLLSSVKSTPLGRDELRETRNQIFSLMRSKNLNTIQIPEIPNRDHWFADEVAKGLTAIKESIDDICSNISLRNFYYVCLSAIIRPSSYADDDQIFPEKTKWGLKKKKNLTTDGVLSRFEKSVDKFTPKILDFSSRCDKHVSAKLIGKDARSIELPNDSVELATTSPPYINAMDYSRVNQLEMYWLGLIDGQGRSELKKDYIGTESVSSKTYTRLHQLDGRAGARLNKSIEQIYSKDKLRAYVTYKFFVDMRKNFEEVFRVLRGSSDRREGRYVVVIGDGVVRRIPIPTHDVLCDIAKDVGFEVENTFSYVIRHRTLLITRAEHSGIIDNDWILTLRKSA
ncbi:MAG: hypothetical protein JRN59_02755 [Nitrososphaerota archaeon]|nr:hypothetical protein [Nitrososphaerota archaeon]